MIKDAKSRIDEIQRSGKYRQLRLVEQTSGPEMVMDGKKLLNFASNNYLGLSNHPVICQRASDSIATWGTGSGASRLITGNTSIHEELEKKIADFKKQESSVVFNCGYMANVGGITALTDKDCIIYSDSLNHASIIDGARLSKAKIVVYDHCDLRDLEAKIRAHGKTGGLIVSDGVFSMDGDIAPVPELAEISSQYECALMIDDAHGTGVLGKAGRGVCEYFNLDDGVDLHMGTLSKALGSEGGFIAGSDLLAEILRNVARPFIFSTALTPSSIAASSAAIDILLEENWRIRKLSDNSRYLREGIQSMGLDVPDGITPIIPVIIGKNDDTVLFSSILEQEGIFSPAIRPPTVPEGSGRIRLTVMATHTRDHLDQAISSFETAGRKTGLI
ncbi:8-amino-7-oxononanoate synthase [Methanospirillum lacunae]|uniref:8-amino-7-ketopelargonate synthase n=1 Tax=Methanospirillum lacunae TaxID=668570 RepID=A0A2V2NF77_9EURY|nr:8-amino-7-oxononanoate synthase [Methanospirillum lacunae]PWR74251.1 8-amino-7-oxononanoate synthase [Methanospirillum lacunae]